LVLVFCFSFFLETAERWRPKFKTDSKVHSGENWLIQSWGAVPPRLSPTQDGQGIGRFESDVQGRESPGHLVTNGPLALGLLDWESSQDSLPHSRGDLLRGDSQSVQRRLQMTTVAGERGRRWTGVAGHVTAGLFHYCHKPGHLYGKGPKPIGLRCHAVGHGFGVRNPVRIDPSQAAECARVNCNDSFHSFSILHF
jgi:hypothetical protein